MSEMNEETKSGFNSIIDNRDVFENNTLEECDIQYLLINELITVSNDMAGGIAVSVGVISVCRDNIAFITDLFFDKKQYPGIEIDKDKTIVFNPIEAKFSPDNCKIMTSKYVYLVCYVKGEMIRDEKTGNEQYTINYGFPIKLIRLFPKKDCKYMEIQEECVKIVARKESFYNCEKFQDAGLSEETYKEIEEGKIEEIESELLKNMSNEGIIYSSSFPMILKKVGILNFREYSPSIEVFVQKFLSKSFCFRKNVDIHGVIHPGVIIHFENRNIDDILDALSNNTVPISRIIDKDTINAMIEEISGTIDKEGALYASSFPAVLRKFGITEYKYYATSVKDFVTRYFNNIFLYVSDYTINGKTHPGAIVKNENRLSNIIPGIEQKNISFKEMGIDEEITKDDRCRIGVINVCTAKTGFINAKYVNKSVYPEEVLDDSDSVIYNPAKVTMDNNKSRLNTIKNIYLVQYYVNGSIINSKTGNVHPAIDYRFSIKVIKSYEKKECVYLSVNENHIVTGEYKQSIDIEEKIICLANLLKVKLQEKAYVQASEFPKIAKAAGIDYFRNYADSVELFVDKYLPEFCVKKNVVIDQIKYPGIIYLEGSKPREDNDEIDHIRSADKNVIQEDLCILKSLYEDGEYQDLLSAELLTEVPLYLLPEEYITIILESAARLVCDNYSIELEVTEFQKELIEIPSSVELVKKWKDGSSFAPRVIEQCAESTIVPIELPRGNSAIAKMLNAIGYSNARNDNYVGLTKRFATCTNAYTPYILYIRASIQKNQNNIEKCISEFIQMVKDIQNQSSANEGIYVFADFLKAIDKNLIKLFILPQNMKTNIVSVYIDAGELTLIRDIVPRFSTCGKSIDEKLIDLYFNYMKCTEKEIKELLQENVSKQLLQKVISLLWEEYADNAQISGQMIRVLSWICLNDKSTTIDEILRFHLVKKNFNKHHKQLQLLKSLPIIKGMIREDIKLYILGAYVVNIVAQDLGEEFITEECLRYISEWRVFSEEMFSSIDDEFKDITFDNEEMFCGLFKVFILDYNLERRLQKKYSEWYIRCHSFDDPGKLKNSLDKLYEVGAYEAYINVCNNCINSKSTIENAEKYTFALIELHRYAEAVSNVQNGSDIAIKQKELLLIRIIAENFRENGLTAKAYSIFGEFLTIDNAIALFMNYIKPNQFHIVNGLMALYCYKKEYLKVMYLYQIYQAKAESGFTRLYAQIRSRISHSNGKLKNHYDVIELAFSTLLYDELIEFFEWAHRIIIPEFKGYKPIHTFSYYYNKLIENPTSSKCWSDFLAHLSRRVDINAWMIVVCETVLDRKIGVDDKKNSRFALNNIIKNPEVDNIPYNFLPYIHTYVIMTDDIDICQDVCNLLRNSDAFIRLVKNNPWYFRYKEIIVSFKNFCVEQYGKTGREYLYKLSTLLGLEISTGDLAKLVHVSSDKAELFRQICRNYLFEREIPETIELLNESEWGNMSQRDMEVLDLLKMLFRDDEDIIVDEELFHDEIMVRRFKQDCANILSVYPEKEELFKFEKSCINTEYKLIMYSYIFKAIYNEDIYDEYKLSFSSLKNNYALYKVYLKYLMSAFRAQLELNHNYLFFYKRWRYLKMSIAEYLYYGSCDEKSIVSTMKRYGHYDEVYHSSYRSFNDLINSFLENDKINDEIKRHFLFSLMEGEIEDFLREEHNLVEILPAADKTIIRKMIYEIDYREANRAFYVTVKERIRKSQFEESARLAEAISEYALDTINNLNAASMPVTDLELFVNIACLESRVNVIAEVFNMDKNIYGKYPFVWASLLCSREFVFQIYGRIRSYIINHSKNDQTIYIHSISEYMKRYNEEEAVATRDYLLALKSCMEGDRESVKRIVKRTDITRSIPKSWIKEAEKIIEYSDGRIMRFNPDNAILDNSQKSRKRIVQYSFLNRLCQVFDIDKKDISIEDGIALYEKYRNKSLDWWTRLSSAVELAFNYPRADKRVPFPDRSSLILMTGLDSLSPEINISDDDKLSLVCELYENYNEFTVEDEDNLSKLKEEFLKCLNLNISIYGWVKNGETIGLFLDDVHARSDYCKLRDEIIRPAASLLAQNKSYEQKYEGLRGLLSKNERRETIYAQHVFDAIRKYCHEIEEGIRLKVSIVNENNIITDGFVYFTVENIGKCTVSLQSKEIQIVFKQEGYLDKRVTVDSIGDLQSGFMTGGRIQADFKESDSLICVSLTIKKEVSNGNDEVICDIKKELCIKECDIALNVKDGNSYGVGLAVTDSDMLFGRSNIQEALVRTISGGITVIYGPSRIGKTSILNWIVNDYAKQKDNVITILFGGEGGMGKETDYEKNFADPGQSIPYDSDEGMSEYLLTQTIIHTIKSMKRRMKKPSSIKITDEFLQKIVQILSDDSASICDRYYEMNEIFASENLELWLLLDEFQQVIEEGKWNPKISCEFVRVCKMLSYEGSNFNIKLIVCGSDDLLRHMVLEDQSIWRQAFPADSRIAVDPLKEKPFYEMIQNEKKIIGTNLVYSDSALKALYSYTGGVALYGKEICNVILKEIQNGSQKYNQRKIIYASDIADATQLLLNRQASEIDTETAEGILEIYGQVTHNLKKDSDMQYLWFIAVWISTHFGQDGFYESFFSEKGILRSEKELHDTLSIAVARGILRTKETDKNLAECYVFRTIFYYFAFLGFAKKNKFDIDKTNILLHEDSIDEDTDERPKAWIMLDQFGELSDEDKMTVISSEYHQKLNPTAREEFRKSIGDHYEGDNVSGTKIGSMNVNIQNISNTISGIIAAGSDVKQVLAGIQMLPRLSNYLSNEDISDVPGVISDERLSRAIDTCCMDYEESLELACPNIDEDIIVYEDLRLSKEEYEDFKMHYNLPEYFIRSLKFAIQLDKLFMKGAVGDSSATIDYSPVTIMYCKLIESLLKEYYVDLYSRCLSNVRTDLCKLEDRQQKYTWGEIIGLPLQQRQKLTIGSFVYPLNNSWGIGNIVRITNQDPHEWESHKTMITTIKDIRNLSAHGNRDQRISLEQKEEITRLLFDDGGFVRLIELAF